jgi:isoquinoline 1-oxidoreductase beta subunit
MLRAIEKGVVRHPSGKAATFGELAGLAQTVVVNGQPKPKDSGDWRLIGKNVPKVDTVSKTNGSVRSQST